MSAEWSEYSLDDVILKRNQGVNTTTEKVQYSDDGIPVIRANNISAGVIDFADITFVDENTFQRIKEPCKPKKGDILYTNIGSQFGSAAKVDVDFDFAIAWNVLRIQPSEKLDSDFLMYLLNNPVNKAYIQSLNSSSTMPFVSGKEIGKTLFNIPDLGTQREISKTLKSLDNKIQLNRQTNQTLEQIAQAIFKSWFVDFEPVKAKVIVKQQGGSEQAQSLAAQAILSGAITLEQLAQLQGDQQTLQTRIDQHIAKQPGLNNWTPQQLQATAALFPNALVDAAQGSANVAGGTTPGMEEVERSRKPESTTPGATPELRGVPEGWEPQHVEDVIELAYGKALKKTDRVEGAFPVYGSGGLTGTHNKALVNGPGIIVGRKGTVGSLHWEDKDFFPIDTVFYVVCKSGMTLPFAYYLLQGLGLSEMNTDAAVPGLNRNNVYRLEISGYPGNVIECFTDIVDTMRNAINSFQSENVQLSQLRDTLLPKLLSGEIELTDAA